MYTNQLAEALRRAAKQQNLIVSRIAHPQSDTELVKAAAAQIEAIRLGAQAWCVERGIESR